MKLSISAMRPLAQAQVTFGKKRQRFGTERKQVDKLSGLPQLGLSHLLALMFIAIVETQVLRVFNPFTAEDPLDETLKFLALGSLCAASILSMTPKLSTLPGFMAIGNPKHQKKR